MEPCISDTIIEEDQKWLLHRGLEQMDSPLAAFTRSEISSFACAETLTISRDLQRILGSHLIRGNLREM
jgi:hypothetical protein